MATTDRSGRDDTPGDGAERPHADDAAWLEAQCREFVEAVEGSEAAGGELDPDDARLFVRAVESLGERSARPQPGTRPGPERKAERAAPIGTDAPGAEHALGEADRLLFERAVREGAGAGGRPSEGGEHPTPERGAGAAWQTLLRELASGRRAPHFIVDLHGLRVDEALVRLRSELGAARAHGLRLALVVTGKGLHSVGSPVLRAAVEAWFRGEGQRIAGNWAQAPRRFGGQGAYVALLKRSDAPADAANGGESRRGGGG